jgi:hypothetical protein
VTFLVVWLCVVCGCVISAVLFLVGDSMVLTTHYIHSHNRWKWTRLLKIWFPMPRVNLTLWARSALKKSGSHIFYQMTHFRVICRNTSPHNVCIFMCHYRKMYYYCTLTAAWTLIFLTISADVSLFLIISPHESCDIVHLPIWSQFSFSFTPTRLCLYFAISRPLFEFVFFLTPACHMRHISFFSHFFLSPKF